MSHYGDQSFIRWTSNQYSKWPYVNIGNTYCVEKMLANQLKSEKEIDIHTTMCGGCCLTSLFQSIITLI